MLTPETEALLDELNAKQRSFVLAYAVPSSATRNHVTGSATAAGYAKKTAAEQGSRLLTQHKIKQAILFVDRDYREKRDALALVDNAWLHKTLSGMAATSLLDFLVIDEAQPMLALGLGLKLDLKKLADHPYASRRIDSIKIKIPENELTKAEIELKMVPIDKILKMAGEHTDVGAWAEPEKVSERSNLASDILAGRKRAEDAKKVPVTRLRAVGDE